MIRLHPGQMLAEELKARDMSANALALAIRVPANRITEIVGGRRAITPETAIRLGVFFGTGADLWLKMQASYDLYVAEKTLGEQIRREVQPAA